MKHTADLNQSLHRSKIKILPKGTEITCPVCERIMVRSNRDITSGELLKSSYFDPVQANPLPHTRMECPFDGASYGIYPPGKVHTKEGWK
jgi:hypothetical protein